MGDIDFLARTLRVKRQIQRAKAADVAAGKDLVEAVAGITVMTRPPKYESERTIYLPDELVAILAEHVRQHTRPATPTDGCSPRSAGRGMTTSSATAGGLPGPGARVTFKLHELRHYIASGLIAAGCDVATVQRATGRASATTTLSTYAHLWPTVEDKTRAAASGMAAAVLSAGPTQLARR